MATVVIVNIVNKQPETPQEPEEVQQVIQLPETTYNNMEVKNVQMEYLKDNDETIVKMELHNTTENVLENEKIDGHLGCSPFICNFAFCTDFHAALHERCRHRGIV